MKSVSKAEILLFFNQFHDNTVDISITYMKRIALFAVAIYNIYNIYSAKNILMDYMTAKEAAEKWAITPRWVQVLCA